MATPTRSLQRRRRRSATVVFLFALLASAGGFSAGRAGTAAGCARPVNVPGLGRSCPVPGGWEVLLNDGSIVLSHGHDGTPALIGTATPVKPACVSDPRTQFHNVLIYAHASDRPNLYTARLAELRGMVAEANGLLRADADRRGRDVDYRFLCANGLLVVNDAPLVTRNQDTNLDTLITGLRALGFSSPMSKYWVWYEGKPPGTAAGTATLEYDDRAVVENRNNFGPSYGVTWGVEPDQEGAQVMMHQNAHTMGAVQMSAPHSTKAGHCIDGRDVMCEADGGPSAGGYSTDVCATVRFDCGNDDYFDPAPSSGGYLATHWNIASPLNRFVSGCLYGSGLLALGAGGLEVEGVTNRGHAVATGCAGRAYVLSATVVQPAGAVPLTSSATSGQPVPDVNVCWYAGLTKIRCDTALGTDRGTIPATATAGRVVLNIGAAATYVLSAI